MTRLGHRVYREKVVQEVDPRGLPYYWIGAGPPEWTEDEGSDIAAVNRGLASVTPLHLDLTHYGALGRMGGLGEQPQRAPEEAAAVIGRRREPGAAATRASGATARERERMVAEQLVKRGIADPRVLEAMRSMPRHLFVDEALRDKAYGDHPLPIGEGQTISQPFMVAAHDGAACG